MPSTNTAVYLNDLSKISVCSSTSMQEAVEAILKLLVEQLGMRSAFLARITQEENRFEVLAAYNAPGGCNIAAGAILSLSHSFSSIIGDSFKLSPLLIENAQTDPTFSSQGVAAGFPN